MKTIKTLIKRLPHRKTKQTMVDPYNLVPPPDGTIWHNCKGTVVMSMKTFEELRGM